MLLIYREKSMGYPLCFDSQSEFNRWNHYARISQPNSHICTDCNEAYQQKMINNNRCEKPNAIFKIINGELVGVVKWEKRKKGKPKIKA